MDARGKKGLGVLNLKGWDMGGNFLLHLYAAAIHWICSTVHVLFLLVHSAVAYYQFYYNHLHDNRFHIHYV